jgi:uncharacterized membrane protein
MTLKIASCWCPCLIWSSDYTTCFFFFFDHNRVIISFAMVVFRCLMLVHATRRQRENSTGDHFESKSLDPFSRALTRVHVLLRSRCWFILDLVWWNGRTQFLLVWRIIQLYWISRRNDKLRANEFVGECNGTLISNPPLLASFWLFNLSRMCNDPISLSLITEPFPLRL